MRSKGRLFPLALLGSAMLSALSTATHAQSDLGLNGAHILPPLSSGMTGGSLPPAEPMSLSVPIYHSLPSSTVKLYIDFDGDTTFNWSGYSPGVTPAYSIDADTSNFSAQELSNIHEMWMRVSEAYSPFNIDVTTQEPADQTNRHFYRVVVGGDGKNGAPNYWVGLRAGGISFIGGFANGYLPNYAYVFPGNLGNGTPKFTAEAIAHEAGHGFGLYHQSTFDSNGNQIDEYNPGTAAKAPFMGRSYDAIRPMWWTGTSLNAQTFQSDLDVISGDLNGVGYRPLDHGTTVETATPLSINGNTGFASGVLRKSGEGAFYSFSIEEESQVTFDVTGALFGQMLSPSLMLFQSDAGLLQYVSHTDVLQEHLSLLLPAGMYDIGVLGNGDYGDVGQYFLTAAFDVAVPEPVLAISIPSGVLLLLRRRRVN